MKHIKLSFLLLCITLMAQAQTVRIQDSDSTRLGAIEEKLAAVAAIDSTWYTTIEVSVGMMPLSELMRYLAKTNNVNIGIRGAEQIHVTCNFANPKLIDLVFYLCKEYDLDMDVTGSIVSIFPIEPEMEVKVGVFQTDLFNEDHLYVDDFGLITAQIAAGDVQTIIIELCSRMGLNYFFISPVSHQTSIYVNDVDFETLLGVLLAGTPHSFYYENGIYIFGDEIISVKVVPLRFRSVNKVEELIPDQLKRDLQVKQFNDLNSIVLCGGQLQIGRVEAFIKSIDHSVPLITIEVMIAEVTNKTVKELGLSAGLGKAPESPQTYTPFNMTLNANTINNLLNLFGPTNLGRVGDDFYLSIKALEEKGVLEIKSTPKLSTLNGHEALLKSGETQYYKEIINNIIGTQNPMQSESYTWKSIEANMILRITPFVSADSTITLDIDIEQGEFTAREEKTAPPGIATRSFKSQIRIRNEEMVLLGGIDRSVKERISTGLPLIARVPVLRWIFGTKRNNKSDYKLTLFIKPTVVM